MTLTEEELKILLAALCGKKVMGTDVYLSVCQKLLAELDRRTR